VNNNGTYSKQQYLQGHGQEGTVTNGSIMVNTLDGKNNVVYSIVAGLNQRMGELTV
jgi:hypothetical protein